MEAARLVSTSNLTVLEISRNGGHLGLVGLSHVGCVHELRECLGAKMPPLFCKAALIPKTLGKQSDDHISRHIINILTLSSSLLSGGRIGS